MSEQLAVPLERHGHFPSIDCGLRMSTPIRNRGSRWVAGIRKRREGQKIILDIRILIDCEVPFCCECKPDLGKRFESLLVRGSFAIDMGANAWAHTSAMIGLICPVGQVLAFESNAAIRARVEHNARLNRLTHVSEYGCVLGAPDARLKLQAPRTDSEEAANPEMASLDAIDTPHEPLDARMCKLYDLVFGNGFHRVDVVKLDVQRSECSVLEGIRDTLARFQPAMIFECEHWACKEAGKIFGVAARYLLESAYLNYQFEYRRKFGLTPFEPTLGIAEPINFIAIAHQYMLCHTAGGVGMK